MPASSVRRVAGAAPPSAAYTTGFSSVPVNDQWACAKPRAETTRMTVSSKASRVAVTAALNRIPATASAVAAASRTSAAVRGLMAGQTAARYCPAASANALGAMATTTSWRARARKPARRPRTRATIPYSPPAVGYSAPSSAQPTARQPLITAASRKARKAPLPCWRRATEPMANTEAAGPITARVIARLPATRRVRASCWE
jgi:hypothetical protein